MSNTSNDEIDLMELAREFWRKKLIVLSLMAVSFAASLVYMLTTPAQYMVTSKATVQLYPPTDQRICPQAMFDSKQASMCWTQAALKPFGNNLGPDWRVSPSGALSLVAPAPLEASAYAQQLEEAVSKTNQEVLSNARLEIGLIGKLVDRQMAATDTVAQQNLNAVRAIVLIEGGTDVISVSLPVIAKAAPRTEVILAGALFVGLFLGIAYVLVASGFRKRS